MPTPTLTLAQAQTVDTAKGFVANIFTGLQDGDIFSWIVVGIVVWILARFLLARWAFAIVNNTMIFGGVAYAVWWGAHWLADEKGWELASQVVLYGGLIAVFLLYFAMLYVSIVKHMRDKDKPKGKGADTRGKVTITQGDTTTRFGAGSLQHQNIPVHQTKTPTQIEFQSAGGGPRPTGAGATPDDDVGRLEHVLTKLNIVNKAKDQNFMTVMVLILVAEFGVFTGKTIAAPTPKTGMVLALIFALGAVIFVKTSYKNYMRGVTHFVFATVFAVGLSLIMLVYWQTWCTPELLAAGAECAEMTGSSRWTTVLNPNYYFASDGLIAAISAVAFSTLLTKGGG